MESNLHERFWTCGPLLFGCETDGQVSWVKEEPLAFYARECQSGFTDPSIVMGVGQLIGASLGGLCVDIAGFYGLMGFSVVLGLVSLTSVLYMRINKHDL